MGDGIGARMSLRGGKPASGDSGEGGSELGESEGKSGASTPVRPVVGAGAEPLADAAGRVKLDRVPDLLFCCIKLSEGDPASLDLRRDLLTRIAKTRLLDGGEDGQMVRHEVTLTPRFARMVNQMAASLAKLSRGYKVNMKLASLMVCVAEMAEQLLASDALAGAARVRSEPPLDDMPASHLVALGSLVHREPDMAVVAARVAVGPLAALLPRASVEKALAKLRPGVLRELEQGRKVAAPRNFGGSAGTKAANYLTKPVENLMFLCDGGGDGAADVPADYASLYHMFHAGGRLHASEVPLHSEVSYERCNPEFRSFLCAR